MTLTLLPAVDVADGQAVRLVQGAAGTETALRRPARGGAGLAARRRRAGSTWSTSTPRSAAAPTPRCWPRWSRRLDVHGGAVRRHPRRRVAARPRWPPARPGSTSAPPRWRTRSGATGWSAEYGDRVAIGLDVRGPHAVRPRLDPGRRRPVRGAGPAGQGRLRPVRGDRHPQGRHDARAQPGPAAARSARRTDAPVIACGGVSTLDDLRALAALEPLGVEGVIVGKALYAGAFTVAEALGSALARGGRAGRGADRLRVPQ